MSELPVSPHAVRASACRDRVVFNFGADLEVLLVPMRRAIRERAQHLSGDLPAAALQLVAESQARRASPIEAELIMAALAGVD